MRLVASLRFFSMSKWQFWPESIGQFGLEAGQFSSWVRKQVNFGLKNCEPHFNSIIQSWNLPTFLVCKYQKFLGTQVGVLYLVILGAEVVK